MLICAAGSGKNPLVFTTLARRRGIIPVFCATVKPSRLEVELRQGGFRKQSRKNNSDKISGLEKPQEEAISPKGDAVGILSSTIGVTGKVEGHAHTYAHTCMHRADGGCGIHLHMRNLRVNYDVRCRLPPLEDSRYLVVGRVAAAAWEKGCRGW